MSSTSTKAVWPAIALETVLTVILTWLGVSVVHSVSIQLEELHRLCLLLSVAAHGKGVLTHLWQEQGDTYLFINEVPHEE